MKWRTMWINLASILSVISLINCLLPAVLCFAHIISKHGYIIWLDHFTVLWFLTSPFWFTHGLFGKKFEEAAAGAWLRLKPKKG